jgi:hypothetical protein
VVRLRKSRLADFGGLFATTGASPMGLGEGTSAVDPEEYGFQTPMMARKNILKLRLARIASFKGFRASIHHGLPPTTCLTQGGCGGVG